MKKTTSALLLLLVLFMTASCDKNPAPGGGGDEPGDNGGVGTMEQMTPEESKKYLQNVALEFMGYFDAKDQSDVIELAGYFIDKYGDLEAPEEFLDEDYWYSPNSIMKGIRSLSRSLDAPAMKKYFDEYIYNINFERLKGIYEPGRYEWLRTGDSNDIIIRFSGPNGSTCEAIISASGGESSVDITYTDEFYDYWSGDTYVDDYIYNIRVPKNVTLTLTENSKQHANAKVVTTIDYKGHTYTTDCNATVANISADVTSNGNDSKLYQKSTVAVGGHTIFNSEAEVKGHNLCNVDKILDACEHEEDFWDDITGWLTIGTGKTDVLGKVQAYANITFTDDMANMGGTYWCSYDYSSQIRAKTDAQTTANVLKDNVDVKLRYNGTATDQASIKYEVGFYESEYNDFWEYYLNPVLLFPDGTTYEFEEYFERGFRSVQSQWNSLLNSYERLFWK